jgi:hypothetical protein
VLVKVDPSAGPAGRADVGRALGTGNGRALAAGWRAYALPAAVSVPEARALLDDAPAVSVQLDQPLHATALPDDPYLGSQWALSAIHAPLGWDASAAAQPVTVAVVDEGVDTSQPDLAGRMWHNPGEIPGNGVDDDHNGYVDDADGWDFADGTSQVYSPADGDDHGTHVAGTIAARRDNGVGVAGVADNARIMPVKFLKPDGGLTSDAIAAIGYAVANGARVINASWGGPAYSPALCDAIRQAGDAGVTVVVAAGNDGQDNDATPDWPANCPSSNVISVAATDQGDGLAWYSNRGATTVDVGAPGTDILSTLPGGQYGLKSGTSMAAPHVSGIAAVLEGMRPDLQPWQVRAAIMDGGVADPALQGVTVSGRRADLAGALGAIGAAVAADATPPDPFALVAPADGLGTTLTRPVFRWAAAADGQSGVAGYRVVVDGRVVASTGPATTQAAPAADLAEGAHRWWVVARDGAGNERASASRGIVIDRTAPSAPVLAAPGASAAVRGPAVELRWRASSDAASGVAGYRVLIDGTAVAAAPATATSARVSLTPGRHAWQVVAADAVGNQAASATRPVTVLRPAGALRPSALLPLAVSVPTRMRSGARPRVTVRLHAPGRVTFTLRRAGRRAVLARSTSRLRAGSHRVTLPARFAARMRAPRAYVIVSRGAGMTATSRVTVLRRR